MPDGAIHQLQVVFLLLLLFVVVFAVLARRLNTPYPIVLVVAGLLLGFVPGIPAITLHPDVVFFVVLPPLLYSAAWLTSWRDFRYNIVSIAMLALGLVAFTVVGVAALAKFTLPGFGWRLGCVLGAVVATTDAIAATAIAKRVGLPQRIVDLLEGESLVNDATGLLALEVGIGMVVYGRMPTVTETLFRLLWLVSAGVAVGLIVGLIVDRFERLLDDGAIEITLSILVPYATYLLAEGIRGSGVLAVVACGLLLSRRSSQLFSPGVRLQAWAVWDSLTFILNGVVFIVVGLQLPRIHSAIQGHNWHSLALAGAGVSGLLIVLRLLWMYPGAYIATLIRHRLQHQNEPMPGARQIFVVGWTGMRGVVALAAALSLPVVLSSGDPFPQRDLIVFLTFCVILVTLVLQGLTLPAIVRALGLSGTVGPDCEEHDARKILLETALAHISKIRDGHDGQFQPIFDDVEQHYREKLASHAGVDGKPDESAQKGTHHRRNLIAELLQVERQTAVRLRDEGRINDEVLRRLERELDLQHAVLEPSHSG